MLEVTRPQALAFRRAGQHLHRRTDPLTAVAACGLQDYPPGWAAVALHARSKGTPEPDEVVTVNAMRGAPYVVPKADARIFTAALVPEDEEGLVALVGKAQLARIDGFGVREALERVAAAAREGLTGGPLEKDAFHQAMRERLPDGLLPWCRGCQSHHVGPGFWRALGPLEVTHMPAKSTWALADRPSMALEQARAELARRFLRCFGPATHTHFASWAQIATSHAKALFAGIEDELEPVKVEGRRAFVLAADVGRLESPPKTTGVRLLGGHDPYVAQPDRAALVSQAALRKRLFPSVGRPGVVLSEGGLAGLWRGRKRGDVLEVELDWVGEPVDVAAEAKAVARLRGCSSALVSSSAP